MYFYFCHNTFDRFSSILYVWLWPFLDSFIHWTLKRLSHPSRYMTSKWRHFDVMCPLWWCLFGILIMLINVSHIDNLYKLKIIIYHNIIPHVCCLFTLPGIIWCPNTEQFFSQNSLSSSSKSNLLTCRSRMLLSGVHQANCRLFVFLWQLNGFIYNSKKQQNKKKITELMKLLTESLNYIILWYKRVLLTPLSKT